MALRRKDNVNPKICLDALYCSDEIYDEEEVGESQSYITSNLNQNPFQILLQQDPFCEDEEISFLLSKESDQNFTQPYNKSFEPDSFLSQARSEAVEWILNVTAHFSFSALTTLLAVNYIDRFIFSYDVFWRDQKPWMTQLTAQACLSLAAKVEEIHVPLLLDLQVEDASKYMFEPKTIQKMEILILSTLQWRMNPVTPLAFLEYITRRLGLKDYLSGEFMRRCELTLLSVISDDRFILYLPSVMATATALQVVSCVAPSVLSDSRNQLLGVLKINKGKVDECCKLITQLAPSSHCLLPKKRKFRSIPGSPNGVMDASFSSDRSNDSWATPSSSPSLSPSVSSSPEPTSKKSKTNKDHELVLQGPDNAVAD